jgi:hypothetical protein
MRPTEELPPAPPAAAVPFNLRHSNGESSSTPPHFGKRLMADDDELEEPMFRQVKAQPTRPTPSTAPGARSTFTQPPLRITATPARARLPTIQSSTRPSTTLRSTPSSRPAPPPTSARLTTAPRTAPRLIKQTSTISLKPAPILVQDLTYLMDDLPEPEISLDFDL